MPTSPINTYSMQKLEPAIPASERTYTVTFAPSQTISRGTILGQITASGKYTAYASGASDGSQTARAIAKYDMVVDSNGNIAFGTSATSGEQGQVWPAADVYIKGAFNCADVNIGGTAGVTSAALGDLQGRVFIGSTTSGVMIF